MVSINCMWKSDKVKAFTQMCPIKKICVKLCNCPEECFGRYIIKPFVISSLLPLHPLHCSIFPNQCLYFLALFLLKEKLLLFLEYTCFKALSCFTYLTASHSYVILSLPSSTRVYFKKLF
jgi:hypothetical protein